MGIQIYGCGTKQFSRTLRKGEFRCEICERTGAGPQQRFILERYKRWITLFWLPVVPLSGFDQVTCKKCRGQFPPNVVALASATDASTSD